MKVKASNRRRNSPKKLSRNRKPRKERKCTRPLSKADAQKLLDAAEQGREQRVIKIILETGMHLEVMHDPEGHEMEIVRNELTWYRPKTLALCSWKIPKDITPLVKAFLDDDLGLHRSTYWRLIKTVADRADLRHVAFITLRRTCIVLSLERGEPPTDVLQKVRCAPETLWGIYANVRGLPLTFENVELDRTGGSDD